MAILSNPLSNISKQKIYLLGIILGLGVIFLILLVFYVLISMRPRPGCKNNDCNFVTPVVPLESLPQGNLDPTASPIMFKQAEIDDQNFTRDYDYPQISQKASTVRIPVLVYHHVAPIPSGTAPDYYVTPEVFDTQLKYLQQKNYKVLTPDEYLAVLKTGKNPTQKSVMITFDDGNYDNYQYAFPILKKYNDPGLFFIVASKLAISGTQLREMQASGMYIGSHSNNHIDLAKLTDAKAIMAEIGGSKVTLERILGSKVTAVAYPGCNYNKQTIAAVSQSGYSLGFTCGGKIDNNMGNRLALFRMHPYSDLENFKKKLSGINEYPYH